MKKIYSILLFLFFILKISAQTITEIEIYSQRPVEDNKIIYRLEECIELAKNNNPQIENAQLKIISAEQTKKMAFTKYFPNASIFGMGVIFNKPFIDLDIENVGININSPDANINNLIQTISALYTPYMPPIDININMMQHSIISGLTLVQPVFTGGRIITGNKLAQLGVDAAQLMSETSNDSICKVVEEFYWLVISLQEKERMLSFFNNMLDSLSNDAQVAYEAGLITKTDVLKVRLKQSELRSQKIKLDNGVVMARTALFQLIGLSNSNDDNIIFWEPLDSIVQPLSVHVDIQTALNNRTEYQLLELAVDAEQLKHRMLLGEALPQIAIGGGGLFNTLMGKANIHTMAFATLSIPLSNWWETSYKLKQQNVNIQIAENTKTNYSELLMLQTQQSWNELNESLDQLNNTKELINESKENLKVSSDYYSAGMLALSDYLQAQGVMHQSLNQYVDDYIVYRKKLSEYKRLSR